jgi:secondary thiamine-phosphate synthase enzyme
MVYSETITVKIKSQSFSDITGSVEDIVRKSEIVDGVCTIFSVGATSAVIINENEPTLVKDLINSLEKIAPENGIYHHPENAYSHIRSAIIGNSKIVPIKDGELNLGTWQEIMVFNFDTEEREREVVVTVIGD